MPSRHCGVRASVEFVHDTLEEKTPIPQGVSFEFFEMHVSDRRSHSEVAEGLSRNFHDWLDITHRRLPELLLCPLTGRGENSLRLGRIVISGIESNDDSQQTVQETFQEIVNAKKA